MYTLFETNQKNTTPRYTFMGFDGLRRRWLENIQRLTGHYQSSGISVEGGHILSRLVGSFSIPLYVNVRKYRDAIVDMSPQLSMATGIVAPTNGRVGDKSPGWFYGLEGKEFLVSVDFGIEPETAVTDWKSIQPLRVLRHTMTDLNLSLPNGKVKNIADGYVVIAIDIPLLGVMYWGWAKEQMSKPQGESERVEQFIGQYVLPNMLYSQTNVAWFNRILATWNKTTLAPEQKVHSIAVSTNYTNIDHVIKQILDLAKAQRSTFRELMRYIPAIGSDGMLGFIQLPDTIVHRQNQWALELAYIPYASLALSLDAYHGSTQNQHERNQIWKLIKRIDNDRIFDQAPRSIRNDVRLDFDIQVAAYIQP